MVFSSHIFLFYYLPLVLIVYYILPRPRLRTGFLAVVSYAFYAWANPAWALIMFASTIFDYICGLCLIRMSGLRREADGHWEAIPAATPRTRGMLAVVIASISANLAFLAFFKYYNFTEYNLNQLALALGGREWVPVLQVVLPVGISFYTFKSMSYCIDVYRGDAPPMSNFVDFNAFEAMFFDLVAGPIIRYGAIAEQLRHRSHTADKFARGIAFLACGLAKKILIANPLGYMADASFDATSRHILDAWVGLFAYSFQIYFDFSGYSDIAVGLGLMFGFVLIKNFDAPYRAQSITEFWRRWHISLSTWLRDYLYIPLGGSRKGVGRSYVNLMVVMVLGGLWHGASWTFVVWGALHGVMLVIERLGGDDSRYRRLPPAAARCNHLPYRVSWMGILSRRAPCRRWAVHGLPLWVCLDVQQHLSVKRCALLPLPPARPPDRGHSCLVCAANMGLHLTPHSRSCCMVHADPGRRRHVHVDPNRKPLPLFSVLTRKQGPRAMPAPNDFLPPDKTAGSPARQEVADLRRGGITTTVRGPVAWTMIGLFCFIILAVPVSDLCSDIAARTRPQPLNLLTAGQIPSRGDLRRYEEVLQENALAVRFVQPRLQQVVTTVGGFGSRNVVIGHEDWLYYRPGVDTLTGPGFLDLAELHHRSRNPRETASSPAVTPDPRPAILMFHRQVRAAGGQLILMPIPDKASVQADRLSPKAVSLAPGGFPVNRSWHQFLDEMREAGVEVFNPAPSTGTRGVIRYLRHDTHWTPEWMDDVARQLAAHIRPRLSHNDPISFRVEPLSVSAQGDLVEMLRLPGSQRIFMPQQVTVVCVRTEEGEPLRPSPVSEVLLLGDSFSNIYSTSQMEWGQSAGLPEHLAYHLRRPIDWIARNDGGAHATREILRMQRAQGRDRLVGKKVVIWQFAARELSLGDWKAIDLAQPPGPPAH